tara:strand:- start:8497 stop:9417 length:921 start_codon:yes stop_codon:yes gene_type:complete
MEKIAFMFLVKSTLLNQEAMWKRFLKNKEDKYSIHVHIAAESNPNLADGLLRTGRIDKMHPTSWGHTTLAHRELLRSAIKDNQNQRFLLLSESCVPLKTFDKTYSWLFSKPESIIKLQEVDQSAKDERWTPYKDDIPFEYFKKHAANYCLNRKDAEQIATMDDKTTKIFNEMENGDEHFLSYLWMTQKSVEVINNWSVFSDWKYTETLCAEAEAKANKKHKAYTELKKRKGITNDPESWNRLSKKQKKELKDAKAEIGKLMAFARDNAKHPRLYSKIDKNILADLDEHYFARKFTTDSDIIKWTPL